MNLTHELLKILQYWDILLFYDIEKKFSNCILSVLLLNIQHLYFHFVPPSGVLNILSGLAGPSPLPLTTLTFSL